VHLRRAAPEKMMENKENHSREKKKEAQQLDR
jgi:hypothetical protein